MADNGALAEIARALRESRTQYNSEKTAEQRVVWSIDPSNPLNRQRQQWRSNGTLFDSSLFTNGEGEIGIGLTATGSDTARFKSSFVGRYVSHALSEPGMALSIDPSNVQIDSNNEVSLDHGLVQWGPFFHDGSTGSNAAGVTNGFGFEIDSTGLRFFVRANSSHIAASPIEQTDFNINRANSDDTALDLSVQEVFNFAYGFYNSLPVTGSRIRDRDKIEGRRPRQELLHSEDPEVRPLLAKPNLPMQVFVSNEGTASTLDAFVGGMQYARYGGDPGFRVTSDYRVTSGGTFTAAEADAPDPASESGDAFFAYQRESGAEDLTIRDREVTIDPTADVYIYFWDEWDPATALNGTFDEPNGAANESGTAGDESLIQANTGCTTYTPTIANFRGSRRADAGQKNTIDPTSESIDDRVPQDATRVWTLAIRDGSNDVDLGYMEAEVEEAF